MGTKNGPAPIGPILYTHVTATIPTIPQAIKQVTHKPTKVHKITIHIGDTTNHKETSKQNSQALIHKLQATGPPDTHKIQAIKKLQSGDVRAYITDKEMKDKLLQKKE